ncbi:hypothetical protein G6F57_017215 [Rhizopus arrhizus]|nr:hypothetical protein G6F57_017215 [Rhizopus arrhizus]
MQSTFTWSVVESLHLLETAMPLPDLNLLLALDILLDEGSVAGAARRMNLSAPAMSRTLARIREAVGDPVLVRSGRGLAPTPRALELRDQVRSVVEQAQTVFSAFSQDVTLGTVTRVFTLRANDVCGGAFGGRLREHLRRYAPHSVPLHWVIPEVRRGHQGADALHHIVLRPGARRARHLQRRHHPAAPDGLRPHQRVAPRPGARAHRPGAGRSEPDPARRADHPHLPRRHLRPGRFRPDPAVHAAASDAGD